jgi:AcrR family transcriptional regulator
MSMEEDPSIISGTERQTLRADAARNARRILDAAHVVLKGNPQASSEDIARAAGLGVATLYRRFPTREDLIQGILWDIFERDIAPALARAEQETDPREGVRISFEAALSAAVRLGTPFPAGMTLEMAQAFVGPVSQMIFRSQQQGLIRADLDPEKDTLRLLLMLLSVVPTFSPSSKGWNRYLRLVMDSLAVTPTEPLPPTEASVDPFQHGKSQ